MDAGGDKLVKERKCASWHARHTNNYNDNTNNNNNNNNIKYNNNNNNNNNACAMHVLLRARVFARVPRLRVGSAARWTPAAAAGVRQSTCICDRQRLFVIFIIYHYHYHFYYHHY